MGGGGGGGGFGDDAGLPVSEEGPARKRDKFGSDQRAMADAAKKLGKEMKKKTCAPKGKNAGGALAGTRGT